MVVKNIDTKANEVAMRKAWESIRILVQRLPALEVMWACICLFITVKSSFMKCYFYPKHLNVASPLTASYIIELIGEVSVYFSLIGSLVQTKLIVLKWFK